MEPCEDVAPSVVQMEVGDSNRNWYGAKVEDSPPADASVVSTSTRLSGEVTGMAPPLASVSLKMPRIGKVEETGFTTDT